MSHLKEVSNHTSWWKSSISVSTIPGDSLGQTLTDTFLMLPFSKGQAGENYDVRVTLPGWTACFACDSGSLKNDGSELEHAREVRAMS